MLSKHIPFALFLLLWFVLQLITASFTELYADEAYYWMYAQHLDWGYFDHPPAIALMIKMGAFLGKNELAVRFFTIVFTTSALAIIYHLVQPKRVVLFSLTLFSFLTFHILGFLSLPDTPFFLFSLLFMLAYKRFLKNDGFVSQVLLGLTAALMLYGKYHGAIVILFVICSNPKLLLNYRFYIAGIIGILLFAPHIAWQIQNDFPSFKFHLVDRASPSYHIMHTLDYVLGNLPFHGGIVAIVLFIASFFYKSKNKWESALKWNLYGTFLFFFFITFKGQYIEANWTLFCSFPMIYFGYKIVESSKWIRSYQITAIITSVLLFAFHIHFIQPFFVIKKDRVWDFHGAKSFVKQVEEKAGTSIIAANNFQHASLMNFYADLPYTVSSLNINSRANQFSLWKFDRLLCDTSIAYINHHIAGETVIVRNFSQYNVSVINQFSSNNAYELKGLIEKSVLKIKVATPCSLDDISVFVHFYKHKNLLNTEEIPLSDFTKNGELLNYSLPLKEKESTKILLMIKNEKVAGSNGNYILVNVE